MLLMKGIAAGKEGSSTVVTDDKSSTKTGASTSVPSSNIK